MRRYHSIITLLMFCLVLISCNRQDNIYTLEGIIENGSDDNIIVVGFDNRFDYSDTIKPVDGKFTYTLQVDTITPLLLFHTDGTRDIVFAEKNITSALVKSDSTSYSTISGGAANDELTEFRHIISGNTNEDEIYAQIDSFVTRNPFSEAIPYLIYEYMVVRNNATASRINSVIDKMSGLLQDHQFILDLTTNLRKKGGTSNFLSRVAVSDTANNKIQITDISNRGYQVVYVWASWHEQSRKARREIASLPDSFPRKELRMTPVSLDTNFERWKKATEQDSIGLQDYNDNLCWNSRLITTTGIYKIPAYLLLSSQETILGVSFTKEDLIKLIKDKVPDTIKEK